MDINQWENTSEINLTPNLDVSKSILQQQIVDSSFFKSSIPGDFQMNERALPSNHGPTIVSAIFKI